MQKAAVTGTNGKTSVVEFARQLLNRNGWEAASLGTLGLNTATEHNPRPILPPGRWVLPDFFSDLARDGTRALLFEAYSRNLVDGLLDSLTFEVGAFTNLDRDHLDYHGTADAYLQAKTRLFEAYVTPGGCAVLNANAPQSETLTTICRRRQIEVITYGAPDADLRILNVQSAGETSRVRLACFDRQIDASIPVMGGFMLENVLCSLGICTALGADMADVLDCLPSISLPVGRMQRVARVNGASIYVDYAHTAGALQAVLTLLQRQANARLVVVLSCGGDPGKRPLMGAVACRLADRVYVTDHTPTRGDNPDVRRDILAMCPSAVEVPGRARAITQAIDSLCPGDVLIVAGRGHEHYEDEDGEIRSDHERVYAAVNAGNTDTQRSLPLAKTSMHRS